MMIKIIKNAQVYTPEKIGNHDLLVAGEKITAIDASIDLNYKDCEIIDATGKIITPGLIDQHIHITGAGGKHGYHSMTPSVCIEELIACGSTTVVGLLGTDGVARSLNGLYANVKALELEGLSAFMHTSYFGLPPITFTGSVLNDMILIDKVIGCKVAISDPRASYPTENELLKLLREVHVGGLTSGKGGILHVHLGAAETGMEILIKLVAEHGFPIEHISPTHVGRTKQLFEQAIVFAKMGGMIDISTGGTKYDLPYKQVMYALEQGVPIDNITLSSDGNAGMGKKDEEGNIIGFYKAPLHLNLENVIKLVTECNLPIEKALKLITSNPAKNLSIKTKGRIAVGTDADLCFFNSNMELTDVMARGAMMMENKQILKKNAFSK